MKWKVKLVSAMALTFALIAAACGGGEEATPAPRPTTAPRPTATTAPQPTARPQATSTAAPQATAAPRPQPTATPRPQATTPPSSAPTGKLRVVVSSFLEELLDPSNGSFGGGGLYMVPLYDFTLWATKEGAFGPGVAKSWTLSQDGLSWLLDVRDDLRFHDGTRLTAEDMKFSYDRILRPGTRSSFRGTWDANYKSAEVLSPTSLRVNSKRPWLSFPADVSPVQAMEGAIVPKAYTERVGDAGFENSPIGSGPWKFRARQRGISFSLEAVDAKHPYRSTPRFKDLEILLAPEESTRAAMLRTGAAELIETSFEQADALQKSGFPVLTIPDALNASYLMWGFRERVNGKVNPKFAETPLGNLKVRQALANGINRQEIIQVLFAGAGASAVIYPYGAKTFGYDPNWTVLPYDPSRAKQLLAEAGYPEGRGLTIPLYSFTIGGAPWMPRFVEVLSGYWSSLGINTQIRPIDFAAFQARYRPIPQSDDIVGSISGFRLAPPVDPTTMFSLLVANDGYLSANLGQQAAFDELTRTLDLNRRQQLFKEIANKMREDLTNVGVANIATTYAGSKNLQGWDAVKGGYVGFTYETIAPVR